ncbi:MAG: MlaD family protein [Betaproteobacteria bacterium]|nr:MlaD family protein [Betaproteobacteria bacterium]
MPKPLKVRRVNEIVGLFILLALAISIAALVFGPRTKQWFTRSQALVIHLPPEGSLGLRQGSDVQILGSVVGSVEDIVVTEAGDMIAKVSVRGNFIRFVRKDSRAIIRKPFGIGDAAIEITRGEGEPLPDSGGVLKSTADKAPTQLMDETLAAIRDEALPAIKELRGAISQYALLAADLRGQQGDIQQALRHFNRVGASLGKGEGLAGMLLFDPKPAAELRAALPKINASLDELHATLAATRTFTDRLPQVGEDMSEVMKNARASSVEARRLTAALPELEKSARQVLDTVPGVLLQSQETLRQIQRLTEGIQRSWLVRSYMDQPTSENRLSSERVGTDR